MPVKFGPAGIGPVKEVEETFKEYKRLGIRAAEVPFTYSIYIKSKDVAKDVKKASEKFGIGLTIHAPYWINLNSTEKDKVKKSKERILRCLEVGTWLGASRVVFHPSYYGKLSKEETFEKIEQEILEIQKIRREKKYTPKLAPETTGKVNVFGSIEEIAKLVKETDCRFCLDFAHILARYKRVEWEKIKKLFSQKTWHCHFSGIEYGAKGEKRHRTTKDKEWKRLLGKLPNGKDITIINEAPNPVGDSVKGKRLHEGWRRTG